MPNDDYIKRSDALFELYRCASAKDPMLKISYRVDLCERIEKIPAADVEPVRHGRWIKMTRMMPPEFTGHYSCSECDWFCKKHSIRETDFDYCPGCGAKIDKEVDVITNGTI